MRWLLFFTSIVLFSNGVFSKPCDQNFSDPVQLSIQNQTDLLAKRSLGVTLIKKIDAGADGQDIYFYSGVPAYVKSASMKELKVLRHYSFAIDQIVASKSLKAGPRPFIIPEPHQRDEFVDLTGVFFTTPDFPPHKLWLGFNDKTPYVDFVVDEKTGLLSLTEGNFLIPGAPSKPKWYVTMYEEYEKSGKAPDYLKEEFKRIKQSGGLKPQLEIPIQIINVFKP
jgi:hypothetical protein